MYESLLKLTLRGIWTQNFNFSIIDNVKFKLEPKYILAYNFFDKDFRFSLIGEIIILNR